MVEEKKDEGSEFEFVNKVLIWILFWPFILIWKGYKKIIEFDNKRIEKEFEENSK